MSRSERPHLDRVRLVDDGRFGLQDLVHPLECPGGGLQFLPDVGENGHRGDDFAHDPQEGDEAAEGEAAFEDEPSTEPEHEQAEKRHDRVHRETEDPAIEVQSELRAEQTRRGPLEAFAFPSAEPEHLDDLTGGIVLAADRQELARLLLHCETPLAGPLAHEPVDDSDERGADEDDPPEQWVEVDHHDGGHDERDGLERALAEGLGQPPLDHPHVGEHARQDVALLVPVEPGRVEQLESVEHPSSDVHHDRRRHVRRDVRASEPGEQADHERHAEHTQQAEHLRELPARDRGVEESAGHEREDHGEGQPEQHVDEDLGLPSGMGTQVLDRHLEELSGGDTLLALGEFLTPGSFEFDR